MRIIELNGHFVREILELAVILQEMGNDVLKTRRDKKILLLQPQFTTHMGGVIRIENL